MDLIHKFSDHLVDPRLCLYKLSGDIRSHIDLLINRSDIDSSVKSRLTELLDEDEANKNTLSYQSLTELHKYIQRADEDYNDPFIMFINRCKCIEPKERQNKELEKRLKLLRLQESQLMYDTITASVDKISQKNLEKRISSQPRATGNPQLDNSDREESSLNEFKNLYGSATAVFNSFLVFICTFIFCYKAVEYALPEPDVILQVSFGLGASTLVAIAEIYFLLRVI